MRMTAALKRWLVENCGIKADADDNTFRTTLSNAILSGKLSTEILAELVGGGSGAGQKIYGVGGGPGRAYGTAKAAAVHPRTGRPVPFRGRPAELPSELETAKIGSFFKHLARRAGISLSWTPHDQELLDESIEAHEWCGQVGSEVVGGLKGPAVKALLDDAASGGVTVNPNFLDDAFTVELLLHSEVYPLVTVRDIPRGRTIDVPQMGTPVVSWGVPEGTPIPLFDTTGFLAKVPTTVYPVVFAVEVGLDLLSDSPLEVGRAIEEQATQALKAELDRVIVLGDGVTQPLGVANTVGATLVPSVGGPPGPLMLADAESLYFALSKPYRNPALNPTFVGNDLSYRRLRTIRTATAYNTLAAGPDLSDYKLEGRPFAVLNDLANSTVAFAALRQYVLFRRAGFEFSWETGGKELKLKNMALLLGRGRFGGRMRQGAAVAIMQDAAS